MCLRVVGTDIDRIAGNDGTAKRLVSQLDAPDDVPPGGRIPVNRRIARLNHRGLGLWRDGGRGHHGRGDWLSRRDASDSIQRPLSFVTQRGIVCGRSQRLPGRLCLWPDASERPGGEDADIEEFIRQRFDQLRHSGLARRGRCLRGPHTPPIGRRESDRPRLWRGARSPRPQSDRWTPRTPPRRCGRMDPRAREP